MDLFTEEELQRLSNEVDEQLRELRKTGTELQKTAGEGDRKQALRKQLAAIAEVTGEPPESFLRRFSRAAHKDLCEEGGVLYDQWQQWADLNNKDTLKSYRKVLLAMSITGEVVPMLLVALVVITLHLSVKTICEEYGQEKG